MNNLDKNQKQSLLLANISKHLNKDISDIKIVKNKNGKPKTDDIYFSVSHSHEYLVHAISKTSELGVDIEKIQPARNYLALADRYFSPFESKTLRELDKQQNCRLFYQLWTAKEAICKAEGGRLWFYLKENCLNKQGQIMSVVHNQFLSLFSDIDNYQMTLSASVQSQPIELIYE